MSDLFELIQNDIPEGRQNLQDSHSNLELVAKYCEDNYFRVSLFIIYDHWFIMKVYYLCLIHV